MERELEIGVSESGINHIMTYNNFISKVSLKFNMLKPTYTLKIILIFVSFFTMMSKHKSGVFLPTWNYRVGGKNVYILFQNYLPETSFVVHKMEVLVKQEVRISVRFSSRGKGTISLDSSTTQSVFEPIHLYTIYFIIQY